VYMGHVIVNIRFFPVTKLNTERASIE